MKLEIKAFARKKTCYIFCENFILFHAYKTQLSSGGLMQSDSSEQF
jgi:hypothetical protein